MTDWLTASAMLASGLIVGFMFLYASRRTAQRTGEAERRDLEAKLEARVRQLRELDEAGGGSPEERARLEREAADALRALDKRTQLEPSSPRVTRVDAPPKKPASAMAGFAWGAISAAALAALVFFVTSSAKQRDANEPVTGGGPAGTAAPMAQAQPPSTDPAVMQLEAAVKSNPEDLESRDQLAKAYLDRENLLGVVQQTQYVLKRKPDDARALTYEALVRVAMGQSQEALAMLGRATKADPQLLEAWVGLAWVNTISGKRDEAKAAMDQAVERHPEEKSRLAQIWTEMQKREAAGDAGAQAQPTQQAAASGPSVRVTVSLDDPSKAAGVLFIYARAAGVSSGPPAAVKRLPASGFPVTVELSAADSMMGQPLPDAMRIEARLDSDGNAMTKSPNDLTAFEDNVRAGAAVTLRLK